MEYGEIRHLEPVRRHLMVPRPHPLPPVVELDDEAHAQHRIMITQWSEREAWTALVALIERFEPLLREWLIETDDDRIMGTTPLAVRLGAVLEGMRELRDYPGGRAETTDVFFPLVSDWVPLPELAMPLLQRLRAEQSQLTWDAQEALAARIIQYALFSVTDYGGPLPAYSRAADAAENAYLHAAAGMASWYEGGAPWVDAWRFGRDDLGPSHRSRAKAWDYLWRVYTSARPFRGTMGSRCDYAPDALMRGGDRDPRAFTPFQGTIQGRSTGAPPRRGHRAPELSKMQQLFRNVDRRMRERRDWRPLKEAVEYVRSLGFRTGEEYLAWAQSPERPYDIPYDPYRIYGMTVAQFIGTAPKWLPFEVARELVHAEGFTSHKQYQQWIRERREAGHVREFPSFPKRVYPEKWKGWPDWLGTAPKPFAEAREYARSLGLANRDEWVEYHRRTGVPKGILVYPNTFYSGTGEWQGWADFLGNAEWWPFAQAREYVRSLGLETSREWNAFTKTDAFPKGLIPASPQDFYDEWQGWADWLGSTHLFSSWRSFRPFEEAREFIRSLNLPSRRAFLLFMKSDARPPDIPVAPNDTYSGEWKGWTDWLGKGTFRSFKKARTYARRLGLKSQREWVAFSKSGKRPPDIPASPDRFYSDWQGWKDWLQTPPRSLKKRPVWRPFKEARAFARKLRLPGINAWWEWTKSGARPPDIPSNPRSAYGDEWTNWADWLGK